MRQRYWELSSLDSASGLADWAPELRSVAIVCPRHPGHRRAGPRKGPLSVILPTSDSPAFLWTWLSECLIRAEVAEELHAAGLTGWQVQRATARRADGGPVGAEYWELLITGWGGVAPAESGVRYLDSCAACGHEKYTCFTNPEALIDERSWDGSDFFIVWPLVKFIFVTPRVRKLITSRGLHGARLRPLAELECVSGTLTPSPLSEIMPAARAAELEHKVRSSPLGSKALA